MEIERQHHRTTSELYICFTSRLSHSSSMRRSSKSILSPGRNFNGDNNHSSSTPLTTSLSRRLRKNGSLRGGAQSPALFPSNVKKNRGSSVFSENPEPSSPKVTCIGQVRVKTKKQGKKIKLRANFRRVEEKKGFGSEFSCFLPCKSSCFSSGSSNGRKGEKGCFRWLVSLQEGEEGKGRDIELVVGGEEDEVIEEKGRVIERGCSRRRSIFDDMEFDDLFTNNNNNDNSVKNDDYSNNIGEIEEKGVCVPPKNALLLMRCRSDPNRMASLSQKFLEGSFVEQDDVVVDEGVVEVKEESVVEDKEESFVEVDENLEVEEEEIGEVKEESVVEVKDESVVEVKEESLVEVDENLGIEEEEIVEIKEEICVQVDEKRREEAEKNAKRFQSIENTRANAIKDSIHAENEVSVKSIDEDEEEIVEIEEEICVQVDGNVGVRVEEVIEVKEESDAQFEEELKVREEEIEEESVNLEDFEDEIDEICEDLEVVEVEIDEICEDLDVVEPKIEALVSFSEEMEQKLEEVEDEKQEETMEEHGVQVSSVEGIENREEKGEEQGIEIEKAKENREETEDEQISIESNEIEELVLPIVEETQLIDSEDLVNGCSIETVVIEEKVEESENEWSVEAMTVEEKKVEGGENAPNLVEMVEEQAMEMQEESKVEESIEVEKEEEQGRRKSMEKEKTKTKPTLPDCLLLMMCEPKLSMEVSKETWISSTDFIRCLPERHHNQKPKKPDNSDDQSSIGNKKAKPAAIAAQPPLLPLCQLAKPGIQPGRSSISFPASGGSMANLIEQKLVKAGVKIGYEPFVLPRCKSAPLRSTAKFGCKLEPHRSATCGVGTAGIGF